MKLFQWNWTELSKEKERIVKARAKGKGKKGKPDSKGNNSLDRGQGQGKGGAYNQNYDNKGGKGKGIVQTDDAARSTGHGSQGPGLGGADPNIEQHPQGARQQQQRPEQVDAEQQTAAQRLELPQRQELVVKDDCIELEGIRVLPTSTRLSQFSILLALKTPNQVHAVPSVNN